MFKSVVATFICLSFSMFCACALIDNVKTKPAAASALIENVILRLMIAP
jgi:hypothetical protein